MLITSLFFKREILLQNSGLIVASLQKTLICDIILVVQILFQCSNFLFALFSANFYYFYR